MKPDLKSVAVGDIEMCYFEWNAGSGGGPPVVFAHATGFHARVWDAVIEHFADRHIYALDLHGHGRSGGEPISHWRTLSGEVDGFLDALSISDAMGVGHSMGAHTLLQSAADRPGAFSRLVLFDPVILPPEFYREGSDWFSPDNPHPSIKRKRDFASAEEMIERFRSRDPYALFDARVFEDYCRHGLLSKGEGRGCTLACSPEMEASVYMTSRSNTGIFDAARSLPIPTLVVRAKQLGYVDFKGSPTWPDLASIMPEGKDLSRPDMTHFHPFQDPADAARIIADFIQA